MKQSACEVIFATDIICSTEDQSNRPICFTLYVVLFDNVFITLLFHHSVEHGKILPAIFTKIHIIHVTD